MRTSGHWVPGKKGSLTLFALLLACRAAPGQTPPIERVRPGIEVLLSDSAQLVSGKTVGLVTNMAALDASAVSDVDRLLHAGIHLITLFSPEHGFRGSADPGAAVASTIDSATGLPIYSLYGATRGPSDSMLAGIEVLLVDLPDVGARYYTYLGTTIEVMRSAARSHRTVIVLDRPDPIGGVVQGNILDPSFRSFVGSLAMPMRPGMSLGELARLANLDLQLGADLRVVPAAGWRRAQTLWDVGLPFLPPSPNLKDLESLFHYPGTCLFEGTALSVGRGTDASFRQIGAPWLDAERVIAELPLERLPGVQFRPVRFTPVAPGDGKYAGTVLQGIRLVLTDEHSYDPTLTAVALLTAIRQVHPDSLGFRAAGFDRLAGGPALREAILAGTDPFAIVAGWQSARAEWLLHRAPALIYK
ncbi:MAG TPA: DUF1343 domain-containing protein [Gemmatimonadales bacterium]|nr:DUF1343 domain-containing protein [Gemmatimonadales bacterium]